MMKNLLLTLFTALIASASFSQVTTALVAPGPLDGDTIRASGIRFDMDVTNSGTTAIPTGDTIFYWFTIGTSTTPITLAGTSGSWNIDILTAPLAAGAKKTYNSTQLIFTTNPTVTTYNTICAKSAIGLVAARNGATASSSCYTIERSWLSIDKVTLEEKVKVTNAAGMLNMSSTSNENLTYSVFSISGQVISTGNFNNSRQVDLTGVAKGIYAVVVTNGTEKITKKIAIQ